MLYFVGAYLLIGAILGFRWGFEDRKDRQQNNIHRTIQSTREIVIVDGKKYDAHKERTLNPDKLDPIFIIMSGFAWPIALVVDKIMR